MLNVRGSSRRGRVGFGIGASLAVLGLCATGLFAQSDAANAYSLTGCRFPSTTIKYLVSGQPSSGYDLTGARNDWTNNTDIAGWTSSASAGRADFRFGSYGNLGWSGATDVDTCPGSKYISKTVQIRINRTYTDGYAANDRKGVMAHEIGHAIGLKHNNTNSPCGSVQLMNGSDSQRKACGVYGTRSDDRNGANALY